MLAKFPQRSLAHKNAFTRAKHRDFPSLHIHPKRLIHLLINVRHIQRLAILILLISTRHGLGPGIRPRKLLGLSIAVKDRITLLVVELDISDMKIWLVVILKS